MSYFPFFVDLEGKSCLVVGGGSVAFRKVCSLLEFGATINVVALKFCEKLINLYENTEYKDRLNLKQREYNKKDFEGVLFVIAATDDAEVNHRIAQICNERNILVNAVDQKEDCSFYFPSLVKKDDLVVGVSSAGKSPVLAKDIRKTVQRAIPDYYGELNDQLGSIREDVFKTFSTEKERKQCFESILEFAKERKRILTDEELKKFF
jgi:siroheme synthase-like protein